ncbi:stimulated by retinoic acid gene 8 protein homolog, partial [Mantella aurantiaca]
KRPARPRKATSVTHLIQQLRPIVFPSPNTQATRRQVLHQTQIYIQELENTLESLLKMRGYFKAEESGSSSLKDVKEEYMQMTNCQEEGDSLANTKVASESEALFWHLHSDFDVELGEVVEELLTDIPQTPEALSCPDLIEFERYLHFYKQMMDMVTESHIVTPEQIAQPVVSKAIANLWQDLKQEGDSNICQYDIPKDQSTPCYYTFPSDPGCTDEGAKDNSTGSQEATSSFLSSTPEEILFEDAFDVAADFLNHSAIQTTSSPRDDMDGFVRLMFRPTLFEVCSP